MVPESSTVAALSVRDLVVRYGRVCAVDGVSFDVRAESVVGLLGPNGAGKSSLLGALVGVVRRASGSIILCDTDIAGWSTAKVCRAGMTMTNQTPRPFRSMSVLQNVQVAERYGGSRKSHRADEILELCNLQHIHAQLAGNLTLSQLRQLELARAMATSPQVLLLDEIGAGLPKEELPMMGETIRSLPTLGITVIVVEHVMDLLLHVVDRLICLDQGVTIADGEPGDVMNDSRVIEAYFGDVPIGLK